MRYDYRRTLVNGQLADPAPIGDPDLIGAEMLLEASHDVGRDSSRSLRAYTSLETTNSGDTFEMSLYALDEQYFRGSLQDWPPPGSRPPAAAWVLVGSIGFNGAQLSLADNIPPGGIFALAYDGTAFVAATVTPKLRLVRV